MTETTTPPPADAPQGAPESHNAPQGGAEKLKTKLRELVAKTLVPVKAQAGVLLKQGPAGVLRLLKAIVLMPFGIVSGDWATKFLAVGFVASVALALVSGKKLTQKWFPSLNQGQVTGEAGKAKGGDSFNDFVRQQQELSIAEANVVYLDNFMAYLKPSASGIKAFNVELVLEANNPEAARYLRGNLAAVRDTVTTALEGWVYEELVREEGKDELKAAIAKAIKDFLVKRHIEGGVERVFFTKFAMQ